ncbi:universal stress protein [Haloglomus litoreum]|uniref:universal stress protein n=1 Tax=Haloglomus litoreum TaxID=3034026 RepID=UPI0023E79D68|nr:universal stress protein [Haloglomus sp. DT116]
MHIHVATYDSSSDLEGLEFALDVASVTGGDLRVVHVLRPPDDADTTGRDAPARDSDPAAPEAGPPDTSRPNQAGATDDSGSGLRMVPARDRDAVAASERILSDASRLATDSGIPVETELLFGDPVEAIVSFATADEASLIVVERPRASRRDDARGIADEVMRRAPMPVVVVPA